MRKFLVLALALLAGTLFSSDVQAQQRRITGRVTAVGSGEALGNAAVNVVGTTIGTYTAEDGTYQLLVPEAEVTLLARRVGFKRSTARVAAGQTEANLTLERDVLQLEAQVITGTATTVARLNAPNAVSQVTAEQLTKAPSPTIENALQGKVGGVTITTNSGAPGGGAQIRMRGVTSILGSSDPLYVIDGVVMSNDVIQSGTNAVLAASGGSNASSQDNGVNRIADLNPADVENIEILKGASASAIYGSKASNGVVVITTKRGRSGRPVLSVRQSLGTVQDSHQLDSRRFTLAEAYDYHDNTAGLDSAEVAANFNSCGGYCDHEKELYGRTPLSYETNLSLSGGSPVTNYFASGLLKHDGSIQNNAGYDKQSVRLNLTQLLGQKLKLDLRTNLIHSLTQRSLSNNDNVNVTPYFVLPTTPSWYDLRPQAGVYPNNPFSSSNPIQTLNFVKTPEEIYRFIGSVDASYNVFTSDLQSLQLQATGGVDHFSQTDNIVSPRTLIFEPSDKLPGTATFQNGTNSNGNWGVNLTYNLSPFGETAKFTTSAGLQREVKSLADQNIVTRDILLGQENVGIGASIEVFDNRLKSRELAYYVQQDLLALNERLLLTGAVRAQRSTVNGDVNKFYTFPKVAGSYRLPTSMLPSISEFKIRAAYGQSGNPPLVTSKFTPLFTGNYDGNSGVQAGARRGNANVKPERQAEIEGGVDIAALNSRLALSVSGYQKTITEMLLRPSLAPSTGFTSQDINAGKLRNRGVDVELTAIPVDMGNFSWNTRATFSRNRAVVLSLPDIVGRVACLAPAGNALQTDPLKCPRGFTAGAFGFFYGQGRIEEGASPTQIVGSDTIPGGGGATYQRKFGDTEPDYTVGFSNEFNFGSFRLYGLIDWRKGSKVVNLTQSVYDDQGLWKDTAATRVREDLGGLGISPYIQDAGFVKLREITVSYDIPASYVGMLFRGTAKTARLEFSGRNLLTWTKYEGLDPEVSNFGNQNIVRNQDLAPFPPNRSFFFTISADF